MPARIVSPSLALLRLGSYARQNRIHQALAEIGRIYKTIHVLRTLDNEEYRRRMGQELNKGEASHELSRFLCFGKEGALRGPELASARVLLLAKRWQTRFVSRGKGHPYRQLLRRKQPAPQAPKQSSA